MQWLFTDLGVVAPFLSKHLTTARPFVGSTCLPHVGLLLGRSATLPFDWRNCIGCLVCLPFGQSGQFCQSFFCNWYALSCLSVAHHNARHHHDLFSAAGTCTTTRNTDWDCLRERKGLPRSMLKELHCPATSLPSPTSFGTGNPTRWQQPGILITHTP